MIPTAARYALVTAGILAFMNVAVLGVSYLLYPGYIDTGEPNIVALSWRLLEGHPVYLPIDAAERTTNLYGPYLYLIHSAVFSLFGASVAIGKAPGIAALLLALGVFALSQLNRGRHTAGFAVGGMAAIAMVNLPTSIWDRPETFMLLAVATGVWLNNNFRIGTRGRIAGFGILIGVVIGLKVFAAIYFLPFGLLMLARDGIKACVVTVLVAFAVAVLPFTTTAFELKYLLDLVGLMADKPNSIEGLIKVARYAVYYILPPLIFVVWAWKPMPVEERRETGILATGLVLAMAAVMYPAQKPGAGMYYLLPFSAIAFDLAARALCRISDRTSAVATAVLICILLNVMAIPSERRFFRSLDWQTATEIAEEIKAIAADNTGKTIEIGIGDSNDSYRHTYQRTRLVFDGHPYTLDTSIIIDTTAWGIKLTPATLALIEKCHTGIWLIPSGERPFAWIGHYGLDVYGAPFRESFARAYVKTESRRYFDVYRCRAGT